MPTASVSEPAAPIELQSLVLTETTDIAYPQATWTSFDRYERYTAIAQTLRSALGPGAHRVLDVGDTAGYLKLLEPELWVAGLDVQLEAKRLDGSLPLLGDGTLLPFPDDAFDAVVSSDVLEHVEPAGREAFLAELRRVSRDLVVVAAPFATPGVQGVEDFVRRYALLALSEPQPQLEEHRANGLPELEATATALGASGASVAVVGNGHLWDWLGAMLLRFQAEARPALSPLSAGFDVLYNTALLGPRSAPPYYRHLVVSWTDRAPALEPSTVPARPVDVVALTALLVSADTTEVVSQDLYAMLLRDVLPEVAVANAGIVALHDRIGGLTEYLLTIPAMLENEARHPLEEVLSRLEQTNARLARLEGEIEHVQGRQIDSRERLEQLFQGYIGIYGPVLRVRAKLVALRDRRRQR